MILINTQQQLRRIFCAGGKCTRISSWERSGPCSELVQCGAVLFTISGRDYLVFMSPQKFMQVYKQV